MKRLILALSVLSMAACGGDTSQVENANHVHATMVSFEEALQLYCFDQGSFPTSGDGLQALVVAPSTAGNWNGPYFKTTAELPLDPWGNPYVYEHGAEIYRIISLGPDAEFDTSDDLVTQRRTATAGSAEDGEAAPNAS
jgi:type II secretion system protein G